MKKTFISAILPLLFSITLSAQNSSIESAGEYPMEKNDANNPCITAEQYKIIEKQNIENCRKLGLPYGTQKNMTTTFSWPLKMANGLNDFSYYYIGNYLDQDTTSPGIKDWNCGTVTYDGHKGTDICTFPYPFYKMDNDQVQIIAAAPGTIINRVDGNFDKNCAMGNQTANYITIQHADGSCAMYWHMKLNSLTAKQIGQTVVTGEYLGVVGSSGSSAGPHLHFEVLSGITINTLNDSYAGICNILNGNSWWISQKPYTEPAVIQASVHPVLAVLPACPTTETPNEDSCFAPGGTAKFYIFVRNETAGLVESLRIVNPGGSTFSSWTHTSVNNYLSSYRIFTQALPSVAGTYTFEATYNGIICSKPFMVGCGMAVESVSGPGHIQIYPNPAANTITIRSSTENGSVIIYNSIGEIVYSGIVNMKEQQIDIAKFSAGIYFVKVKDEHIKFIKE